VVGWLVVGWLVVGWLVVGWLVVGGGTIKPTPVTFTGVPGCPTEGFSESVGLSAENSEAIAGCRYPILAIVCAKVGGGERGAPITLVSILKGALAHRVGLVSVQALTVICTLHARSVLAED
jgi:hypothetical protein